MIPRFFQVQSNQNNMKKHSFGCLLFLFIFGDLIAQKLDCPYQIHVCVIGAQPLAEIAKPIEHAEIFIEKDHRKTFTDGNGMASFEKLCSQQVEIEIHFNGVHRHMSLLAFTDPSKCYLIQLNDSLALVKILHKDSLAAIFQNEKSEELLSTAFITAHSQRTQGDVLRATQIQVAPQQNMAKSLEPLPLTQTLSSGMGIGKPVVQGMFGQRLPILNNGFRMEGQTWGLDHAPETDIWGVQSVILLRGTDALAVAADAWGNAINLVNQYDFHEYNRDFTQLISMQTNGGGIHVAGKYLKGRPNIPAPKKHAFGKGIYLLYSGRITGNYSTPTHTLKNTATKEGSLSFGNLWSSKRGYFGIPAVSHREFHVKAYAFQGGIFAESHIGNINDLLAAMQRETPLYDAPFSYKIGKPQQQALQVQASYNNLNRILGKYQIHHKFSLQSNQRLEFDPHRSSTKTFAQLNLWQGSIIQYTGFEKINAKSWKARWVFQNTSQWQRYGGYYFLPNYQQWQPNLHFYLGNKSNPKAEHEFVVRTDLLIRNVFPKDNGITTEVWKRHLGPSAAYSFHAKHNQNHWDINVSQLWRAPSVNELYTQGVHHGAAAYEQGNAALKPESGQKLEILYAKLLPNSEFRFTTFAQYSANFISLFPMQTPVLTVRGAFPGYEYKQMPTFYAGAEGQWMKRFKPLELQLSARFGAMYGKVFPSLSQTALYPNFLPCPKGSIQLQKQWKKASFNIDVQGVGKQPFFSPGTDFLPPPNGYVIVNVQLQLFNLGRTQHAKWVIYAENIGNKKYRDYMDRFRYFTNQAGQNFGVKWIYDVHHHDEHKHN